MKIFFFIRYFLKYCNIKNCLCEFGFLDFNFIGFIFILDEWEIFREKFILNRKLGEGVFGVVFGGEGLGFLGFVILVFVVVKIFRVGVIIEDKVGDFFNFIFLR